MRLVVASGKGGTGKTVVAASLAWLLARRGHRVTYLDADVEEPNGALFLHPEIRHRDGHTVPVPVLRDGTCSGCGACQQTCAFNAIVALADRVLTFPELCHGCGACLLACAEEALTETPREIGVVGEGVAGPGGALRFLDGRLQVGEARATPLIGALVARTAQDTTVVVDSPPGTSCSAMAAVEGADHVLLVTEPTPFGLHDLRLSVELNRTLGNPMSVVINRANLGDDRVSAYLEQEGLPVVARIPFLEDVSRAYVGGRVAAEHSDIFRALLSEMIDRLPLEVAS